jgi:hypothetical protein
MKKMLYRKLLWCNNKEGMLLDTLTHRADVIRDSAVHKGEEFIRF